MTAVRVIAWIGLVGGTVGVVVLLAQVYLLLGVLRDLDHLAQRTARAARGVEDHLLQGAKLPPLAHALHALEDAAAEAGAIARSLDVDRVEAGPGAPGGEAPPAEERRS